MQIRVVKKKSELKYKYRFHSMDMQCINCGKKGHKFRHCSNPIQSYGVACFIQNGQLTEPNPSLPENEWLCIGIQRRHTYSYVDYIRGKYSIHNTEYQTVLLERMTQSELQTISESSFDTMWENLWMEKEFPNQCKQSHTFKENARKKHICMKKKWQFHAIRSQWNTAEWGLPKGRRNLRETDSQVALREFSEETGIAMNDIEMIQELPMVQEKYTANNGYTYLNQYMIVKWKSDTTLSLSGLQTKHMDSYSFCAEIAEIDALSLSQFIEKCRLYETWKPEVLRECFSVIHSKEGNG